MIRHAKAEDRDEWAAKKHSDEGRPLTQEGIEEFTQVAKMLALGLPTITTIYSSPFKRTMQTAEVLSNAYAKMKFETTPALLQGTPWKDVQQFLLKLEWNKDHVTAIVGHENHLSHILGNLITAKEESIRFKKGGVALVDLELMENKVSGKLLWFLPPKFLLKLGK